MNRLISPVLLLTCLAVSAQSREWVDASGKYHIKADLIARNETMVVLEKGNKDLVGIEIDQLSKQDREFLDSKKNEAEDKNDSAMQTWTTRRGLKVRGAVVEYVRRDVTIRRIRGKVYVNDKRFDNLAGIYRRIVPQVVAHFEDIELENEKQFSQWVRDLRGAAKKYTCEGVLLELENGDLYAVPFFLFSKEDLEILQPGWEQWLAEKDDKMREQYSLSLRAQSIANRREQANMRQVAML